MASKVSAAQIYNTICKMVFGVWCEVHRLFSLETVARPSAPMPLLGLLLEQQRIVHIYCNMRFKKPELNAFKSTFRNSFQKP